MAIRYSMAARSRGRGLQQAEDIAAIAAALGCSERAAQALHANGHTHDAAASTVLVHQGDIVEGNWLILDGNVRCEVISPDGRNTVVATHPPGDMIGAFGRAQSPITASLTTLGSTRLLALAGHAIERLGISDGDFALAIARSYARQSGTMLDRLAMRISLTASGRIYARLLELANESWVISPSPIVSALAVSVQTTRETASRAISVLERRGIIRRTTNALFIQSPRMLEEMIV